MAWSGSVGPAELALFPRIKALGYDGVEVPVLSPEALNRFETYFMTTVDEAGRLLEAVDSPGIGVHLDTFHMNVEEKDPAAALRAARKHLAHVHFSENDRGIVGTGHVDWCGVV